MADATGENDLRRLEREAEAARARLHETIAEIKDPRTVDNAKLELKHRAEEMKDQIIGYITGAKDDAIENGRAQGNEFTRKLQRTAIENPVSIALIGAGIGWHLYKKPPITTVLIGAGIYTMIKGWNNSPNDSAFRDPYNSVSPRGYVPGGVAGYGYDEVTDVASAAERVKTVATNLSYGAQNAVAGVQSALSDATDRVREAVGAGADAVREKVGAVSGAADDLRASGAHAADDMARLGSNVAQRAGDQVDSASARAQGLAQDASSRAQDLAHDARGAIQGMADQARDVTGQVADQARGLANEAQRRIQPVVDRISPWIDEKHRGPLGMMLVLGGVGALAGGWLRGSDTGRRWMNEARDGVDDAWSQAQQRVQETARDVSKRSYVEDWRDEASAAASRVSDQASSLRRSAMDTTQDLRRSAMDTTQDMRARGAATMRSAQELGSEHPLLLSAIGLAIGAVLGGVIRQTAFERESFGEMAENLRDAAVDTVQTGMEAVADRASTVATAVTDAVSGTTDELAKAAQSVRNRVNA
ncbi:MAG: Late embryosis abundant protein [Hyphomicrobiales bacterium]|nr:Late embryosis abundant protein [Hyphomicrobiales bacterium]